MFLNFYFDVLSIESEISSEISMMFYKAQVSTAKVVCLVSGGCLLITSVIMLLFYIKHYVDTHRKELGILKALGCSNFKIAKSFWIFGLSTLAGTAIGFGGAFLIMPEFYRFQNEDRILPDIAVHFHPEIFLYFVILPTAAFSALAVGYALRELKRPVLKLLKDDFQIPGEAGKSVKDRSSGRSFMDDLKHDTLRSRKALVFFIFFSAFCFSAMTQMSFSMKDLSSEMMGAMMLVIGLVLAFTTLFLSITTVIKGNTKSIAIMRAFGYSQRECCGAVLGVYRPMSYVGFAVGTVYQYVLLRIMVDIVFRDIDGVPDYEFDFPMMLISLAVFVVIYEILMYVYSEKIKKISIKEIMTE